MKMKTKKPMGKKNLMPPAKGMDKKMTPMPKAKKGQTMGKPKKGIMGMGY